ncbi:MAG TPA: alkaline phosphatase [Amaricoccus sp.]|uniref:alkaline phosphatase n=1 Tax=Amaricoccus sp. TaxID=1872485 RepID=UPI002BD85A06|nr:alkaline phosphatase [Amaricoccus sp.]HMQ94291.1 alkaline phosphatase [Amaricoccus sp.]HMR53791.1 alkaline phosphatase [Amaricoccus sp.]HMR61987.1 alkaline phosphatase [Amaricoccus sp.]HMU01367.1 alkaline phosphatase [Amaricoccus sp.]
MKRLILLTAAMALIPGLALGQAIYPLDRATILSGSKFDFKVEFPTVVQPDQVEVLINGESYDTLLGATAEFIENEDESGGSSLLLRDVSITEPGSYTVEAKAGDTSRSVNWEVFGTSAEPRAKNVIFFLGDGMTVAHRTAARILSKGNTEGKADGRLAIDDLQYMAFIGTSSQDSIHNDSANTMAAYMTGHKSVVNALGVYGSRAASNFDHPKVETIGEAIRRATGKSIGIVTNTEVQDATPAAVVSHTRSRNDKPEITEMHFAVAPEVLMGGGSAYFLPQSTPGSKRVDDKDMIAEFQGAGYTLATSATELQQAVADHTDGKILGLFNTGNLDTTLDIRQLKKGTVEQFPDQPLVADMTRAALDVLSKDPDGFFLMVEDGHTDKATHALDWERAVYDMIALDQAIAVAREFQEANPDTLIIFVGDHTHGLSITGTVDDDKPGDEMREKVGTYGDAGFTNYTDEDGDGYPDRMDVSKRLMMYLGNFPDHYETFGPKLDGQFVPAVADADGNYIANEAYKDVPGAVLRTGNIPVSMNAGTHSVDDEVLQASGPGAENFRGYMENSDVYRVIAEALALAPATN